MKFLFVVVAVIAVACNACGEPTGYDQETALHERADNSCGESCEYIYEETPKKLTIRGTGLMTNYSMFKPSPWKNLDIETLVFSGSITSIGDFAFYGASSFHVKSVTLPSSVTLIGYRAFHRLQSLEEIYLPGGLLSIEGQAFYHCSSLKSMKIPSSLVFLGEEAFGQFENVTSFEGGSQNFRIIDGAIYNGDATSIIQCPSGKTGTFRTARTTTSIGNYAFSHCNLTSVIIQSGVTSIGDSAFLSCTSLMSVDVPTSVERIGFSAFGACVSLLSAPIPPLVTTIEPYAYSFMNITSVVIPPNIGTIGEGAFSSSPNLVSVTIPPTVQTVGNKAFASSGLRSVTIHEGTAIGEEAFASCDDLQSVFYLGTKDPEYDDSAFPLSFGTVCVPLDYINISCYRA